MTTGSDNRRARSLASHVKGVLQNSITSFHRAFLSGELPQKIAIYFHSVEPGDFSAFEEAIAYFGEQGYKFCSPIDFCAEPRKAIFLSFDDNYHSWLPAAGLLEQRGVRATFYVNTCVMAPGSSRAETAAYYDRLRHAGERRPLSVAEIVSLADAGHTIASHTHSHYRLTSLPLSQAKEEIRRGKQELEDMLGLPVRHFSFPYGMRRHFSEELRRYCWELGFQTVASAIPGMQHCPPTPGYLYRSPWALGKSRESNLRNLCVKGALFERITGRSAVV